MFIMVTPMTGVVEVRTYSLYSANSEKCHYDVLNRGVLEAPFTKDRQFRTLSNDFKS